MEQNRVIIIGAGISGLAAAGSLAENGWRVTVVEARPVAGGRIQSLNGVYGQAIEAGAEFLHGGAPLTRRLAKKAGAVVINQEGAFFRVHEGRIVRNDDIVPGMDEFLTKIESLETDMTLLEFLDSYFSGPGNEELRNGVIKAAEGFDAADPSRISVKEMHKEWTGGAMNRSAILRNGYGELIRYLTADCLSKRVAFHFSAPVTTVEWSPGKVQVKMGADVIDAEKLVVTASVGALIETEEKHAISFSPDLPNHRLVLKETGFGEALKVVMEFSARFWDDEIFADKSTQVAELEFLLTDAAVPVYWFNKRFPVVTAWAGGRQAAKVSDKSDEEVLAMAMEGLATSFNMPEPLLRHLLVKSHVFNWRRDPFIRGGYSYATPETHNAKKLLRKPVADTIYFAGAACAKTHGTVEGALESARDVVKKIGRS